MPAGISLGISTQSLWAKKFVRPQFDPGIRVIPFRLSNQLSGRQGGKRKIVSLQFSISKASTGEENMLTEKKRLTLEAMQSQTALELPRRQMLALVNVFITNVANGLHVTVPVQNNRVAVQVCAAVQAINTIIAPTTLTCRIRA